MALELRQQLKLTQQLIMTPQLQMAIKLLQLSRLELLNTIRQELEENPTLDEEIQVADQREVPAHKHSHVSGGHLTDRSQSRYETGIQIEAGEGYDELEGDRHVRSVLIFELVQLG